jgi:general secretion pathway protein K
VVVIVVVLLMTFLASELVMQVRFESRAAHNLRRHRRARFLAEAGTTLALFRILDRPVDDTLGDPDSPFVLGREYEAVLPAGKIRYYAVNESGKIGLNGEDFTLLREYLLFLGLDEDRVTVIIDSLLDWEDADDLHRLNGAEEDYYQGLAEPYAPRNGPMAEPGEFFLVRGTEGLEDVIDPDAVFTVHNRTGKLNVNSLAPGLEDFVSGGDAERRKQLRDLRKATPFLNLSLVTQAVGADRFAVLGSHLTFSTGGNRYYSLVGYGEPAGGDGKGGGAGVRMLVRVGGPDGYRVLGWEEIAYETGS